MTDETPTIVPRLMLSFLSLSLFASNSRRTRRLSLLPVVNKQICLSLGIQHRFRLGGARAAAREEATAARRGLSSARGGRTKGIYDVHLSSHYLPYFLSFPFGLSHLLRGIILALFSRAFSLLLPHPSTPFSSIRLYHRSLAILHFIPRLFV